MARNMAVLCMSLLFLGLVGCGNGNIFGSAHQPGSSSAISALNSDAQTALNNQNYPKAILYYQKILAQDPASAEAIYGYSEATLANSGLSIASIVADLINQSGNSNNSNNNSNNNN
ncbi:MAG: hypothetical protein ABSH12_08110, partial [Endomicrobiales bacterium]